MRSAVSTIASWLSGVRAGALALRTPRSHGGVGMPGVSFGAAGFAIGSGSLPSPNTVRPTNGVRKYEHRLTRTTFACRTVFVGYRTAFVSDPGAEPGFAI